MKNLIEKINSTFIKRTEDILLQKEVWRELSSFFRPDIKSYRHMRPSTLIAEETGDLGLAVLWIVQTGLIRPIISDLVLSSAGDSGLISLVTEIRDDSICALAHSEKNEAPVLITPENKGFSLTGIKKFVTAGVNADCILITCRNPEDEKISRIVFFDKSMIEPELMQDLNLNIMKSVNHTSIKFNKKFLTNDKIPAIDPTDIRRTVKKWGIIERAMIIEAYISYLSYFNRIRETMGLELIEKNRLDQLLATQKRSTDLQIEEALYKDRISTENISITELLQIISSFKDHVNELSEILNDSDRIKFKDIFLFDSLK